MANRDINVLYPPLKERWLWLHGRYVTLYPDRPVPAIAETHRDKQAQEAAFDSGHSKVHFGGSLHNYLPAYAFDVYFEATDGSSDWSWLQFADFGALAKGLGLVWGGDWQVLKDGGHIQIPTTVEDIVAGRLPSLPPLLDSREWKVVLMKDSAVVATVDVEDGYTAISRVDTQKARYYVDVRRDA